MSERIAIATGDVFAFIEKEVVDRIDIAYTGEKVKVDDEIYLVFRARTFHAAREIDSLIYKLKEYKIKEHEIQESELRFIPCDKVSVFMRKRENEMKTGAGLKSRAVGRVPWQNHSVEEKNNMTR